MGESTLTAEQIAQGAAVAKAEAEQIFAAQQEQVLEMLNGAVEMGLEQAQQDLEGIGNQIGTNLLALVGGVWQNLGDILDAVGQRSKPFWTRRCGNR